MSRFHQKPQTVRRSMSKIELRVQKIYLYTSIAFICCSFPTVAWTRANPGNTRAPLGNRDSGLQTRSFNIQTWELRRPAFNGARMAMPMQIAFAKKRNSY
ncbi:hypothetical protein CEXT_383601 [Caerostris extrusa]|uniref:Secreted protein n=1 Tax=Caerostris extrusa TaxID=172846 RepID=A0AAV4MRP6_CAEEX|nr:hypothetical protein CEXT_383601 [Caerostris extrusa]